VEIDWQEALADLHRRLAAEPDPLKQSRLWLEIGHILDERGDVIGATQAYRRSCDLDPECREAVAQLPALYAVLFSEPEE
jgi:cytochrome c-type biogenesis protein CcmH/NrfG